MPSGGGDWFTAIAPVKVLPVVPVMVDYVSNFHVYTFTLVSGYIYFHVRYERGGYGKYGDFIKKKAKRLLVPYAVVGMMWVAPFYSLFFKEPYLYAAGRILVGGYSGQLWYILMLFWIFAIVWPLSGRIRKSNWLALGLSLFAYAFPLAASRVLPHNFGIFNACTHFPFFVIGFKLRQYQDETLFHRISSLTLCVAYLMIFLLKRQIVGYESIAMKLVFQTVLLLTRIIGSMMAWTAIQRIANKVRWKDGVFQKMYLNKSMTVYLLHQQIIYCSLFFFNGVNPYLHMGLNFVISLSMSIGIASFLMKTRQTRYLIGG